MFQHNGWNMDQAAPKKPSPYPGIGARIRANRKSLGDTQHALAGRIGVRQLAICEWENEDATPKLEHLVSLAAAFGVSMRELTGSDLFADTRPDALLMGLVVNTNSDPAPGAA